MSDEPGHREILKPRRRGISRRTLVGILLLAVAALVATGATLLIKSTEKGSAKGTAPFAPAFARAGLVTNAFAFLHPHDPNARLSPDWITTSGSLFARNGAGWTGVPDADNTGPYSDRYTDSAIFRLVTRRRDFGPVTVHLWVRLDPPVTTPSTPARAWDGGHVWLRYHSPQELYGLSFRRRDGTVVIKRKIPGTGPENPAKEDTGAYATLAEGKHAIPYGTWHQVTASAVNLPSGSVLLRLDIDGKRVLTTRDRTPGRLRRPGGVGLRADNTNLLFRDFRATPMPAPTSG